MRAAANANDMTELARLAHAVRGAVGNFNATRVWEATEVLEVAAESGEREDATAALWALEKEIDRMIPGLRQWRQEQP